MPHPPRSSQPAIRPLACILPPHILVNIARNGGAAERAAALDALGIDHTLRSLRAMRALSRGAGSAVSIPVSVSAPPVPEPRRTIYDAGHQEATPPKGTVVRHEGDPPVTDPAVNEAYDGLGATFTLYRDAFDRDSIDDAGLPLNAYVHYGTNYDNAFWDGAEMVFGDGRRHPVQPLHHQPRRHRTRAHPRRYREGGGADLPRPVRGAERVGQ